jgi:hypothetical protein
MHASYPHSITRKILGIAVTLIVVSLIGTLGRQLTRLCDGVGLLQPLNQFVSVSRNGR